MMGHRQVEQAALFYEFSLEKHIPANHLLRSIDRFVDLEQVRRDLAQFESILRRCIEERLVGGEGFAVDASLIKADAPRQRGASAIVIDAPSSLDAALSRLREKYRAQSMRALATWRARSQDRGEGHTSRRLRKKIEMLFAHLKRILNLDRLRLRGQMARVTSSSSQPRPKTLGRWPS